MEVYCTRPGCPRPLNHFTDLDDKATLQTVQQKFCTTCGMPLILVGRYLPQNLLGRGGFGSAFFGRDRYTLGMRQCVVKQFQPAGELSPQQLQIAQNLFEREGEVLEELGTHPQIPDLLAFFPLDVPNNHGIPTRFFYLVQEFIDGKNLEQELTAKGKFTEDEILEVLRETLKVLQYVHDSGSIHRDIKPSNIMRHRNGRLYLIDFGAVKQKVAQGVGAASPGKSTGIYTQWYAAPEQMRGNAVYPSSDLYSLAVTCIGLLTGKEPEELFDSYNNTWSWRQYTQVNDRLEAVLNRMLQANPGDRFASANDVLAALSTPSPPPPVTASPTQIPISTPPPVTTPPVTTPPVTTTPPPPVIISPPPISPPPQSPARPAFSTLELLSNAAFTGFEGGLLGIAVLSVLGTTFISSGFWLVLVAVLVFLQKRRTIEGKDFLIISAITLGIIWIVPALSRVAGNSMAAIVVAVMAGLVAIAVMAVFQIIYRLLSRLL